MVELAPLWPRDVKMSIIGVTGAHESGKTGFILSVCPNSTLLYDMELSAEFYETFLTFERICMPTILREKHGKKKYTSKDVFTSWYAHTKTIQKGQYRVIGIDPIDKIEAGLMETVKARYNQYGFASAEKFCSMGGVFWDAVAVEYEQILMELQDKCECLVYSNHLRKVWRHGKATDAVEPKGKGKLQELSCLRVFLDRNPLRKGDSKLLIPRATVLKNRVSIVEMVEGEFGIPTTRMTPFVPPVLPECTADAIRRYIVTPPNFAALKEEEMETERVLTLAEEKELDAKIAEDQRIAAEASLEKTSQVAGMERRRQEALARLRPGNKDANVDTQEAKPDTVTEAPKQDAPKEESSKDAGDQPLTIEDVDTLSDLARKVGMYDRLKAGILKELKITDGQLTVEGVLSLPRAKYNEFIDFLRKV